MIAFGKTQPKYCHDQHLCLVDSTPLKIWVPQLGWKGISNWMGKTHSFSKPPRWENCNISLTWIVRPFGDDSPNPNHHLWGSVCYNLPENPGPKIISQQTAADLHLLLHLFLRWGRGRLPPCRLSLSWCKLLQFHCGLCWLYMDATYSWPAPSWYVGSIDPSEFLLNCTRNLESKYVIEGL